MIETEKKQERILLVGVELQGMDNFDMSMEELASLAKTAGGDVRGSYTQKREKYDTKTFVGSGKLEEIAQMVEADEITTVVVNNRLTPRQNVNLEEILGVKVIDRMQLILDIFAMRALEIAHFGQDLANEETDYDPYLICLDDERSLIYERINRRVDRMLEEGLLEEARWLYDHYPDVQASKGIGYKELFPYFKGEQSLEEASETLKRNTRRFAKRQLTWFRNRMEVTFYAISAPHFKEQVLADVKEFLEHD